MRLGCNVAGTVVVGQPFQADVRLESLTYSVPATLRRGAAAAELAIVLPFLALMFTATLDFCRIFHTTQAIENSAQVAALYASGTANNPNASGPEDAARKAAVAESPSLSPALKAENVSVSISSGVVVATVTYDFPMLTPFLGSDGVTTIRRTVRMNVAPGGP